MHFTPGERDALCDTVLTLGPDAPTIDEGWVVRDLVAHVVMRERRLDAAAGIVLPPFAGYTARVQHRIAAMPWPRLVDHLRSGPPRFSPLAVPRLAEAMNLTELYVHHEDVRRAQPDWTPRPLPPEMTRALWRRARSIARLQLRRAPATLVLRPDAGEELVTGRGGARVVITGPAQDLVMWVFGRRGAARVVVDGAPADVRAVTGS